VWLRCLGRSKRNRRRGGSLSSRAVVRPDADQHEAESHERYASHPHLSNRSGSSIDNIARRATTQCRVSGLTWPSKRGSPDGAKRNPGFLCPLAPAPDFAALHPGYDPLCCPTGKTPQCWVNHSSSKYSYLQKFCFAVQPETSQPATRGVSRSSRDAGRDAVAATASARGVGCRAVIP
jgi:hypothetical protein